MNIAVSQIYIEAGVNFPFSHRMQMWISDELTAAVPMTSGLARSYGPDFDVVVNLSAKKGLRESEIRGPAVFRKSKGVEYTLFLPYDVIDGRRAAAELLVAGLRAIVVALGLDPAGLDARTEALCAHLSTDEAMLTAPWPDSPVTST